ncbi:hypothetical protein HY68_01450 [Streptomyces sp. AcH 505]|uniref:PadR family transcriptional regulator n=1 Tax=Streptomyces sp. AcH 505 TaxID=352211 RepID=UPI000591B553|nr:hypothetical protein HY68_01450 [Streptomyces sp. AcH 505]
MTRPPIRLTRRGRRLVEYLYSAAPEDTWGGHIHRATGLGVGSIYPNLERLIQAGWATSDRIGTPPHRCYLLTPDGRRAAREALDKAAAERPTKWARLRVGILTTVAVALTTVCIHLAAAGQLLLPIILVILTCGVTDGALYVHVTTDRSRDQARALGAQARALEADLDARDETIRSLETTLQTERAAVGRAYQYSRHLRLDDALGLLDAVDGIYGYERPVAPLSPTQLEAQRLRRALASAVVQARRWATRARAVEGILTMDRLTAPTLGEFLEPITEAITLNLQDAAAVSSVRADVMLAIRDLIAVPCGPCRRNVEGGDLVVSLHAACAAALYNAHRVKALTAEVSA